MFNQWPESTRVSSTTTGNGIELHVQSAAHEVPEKVQQFIMGMGWTCSTTHPDTFEQLYQKTGDVDIANFHFTWAEAMAYEWYRTISLGGI